MIKPLPLEITALPLTGAHLIEASAGTGKTYNITQLYLRLLLEQHYSVEQILVVTFTKAATEELRGRIRKTLVDATAHWTRPDAPELIQHLRAKDENQGLIRLRQALLTIDAASIYTIHGFCSRVLSDNAFTSGIDFDVSMETDLSELALECVRDWYRLNQTQPEPNVSEVIQLWPTPDSFYQQFSSLLLSRQPLVTTDIGRLTTEINAAKRAWLTQLENHADLLLESLVLQHKEKAQRLHEWHTLLSWLSDDTGTLPPAMAKQFCDARRRSQLKNKIEIDPLLLPLKTIESHLNTYIELNDSIAVNQGLQATITWLRERIAQQKQQHRMMGFDDLVNRLSDTLCQNSDSARQLCQQLRQQYPVALVDEFQDTDQAQFAIFNRLYQQDAAGHLALFMIGDPKQAIYGFRGGDINAYLNAKKSTQQHWVMDTNWRSTAAMIASYNKLFSQAVEPVFGNDIDYYPVKAADRQTANLIDPLDNRPLRLCSFVENLTDDPLLKTVNADIRSQIAKWVSGEIVRLLTDVKFDDRAVKPSDIAILVRDRTEAQTIQQALEIAELSAVYLSAKDNVFASDEALDLLKVLNGIIHHSKETAIIEALTTRYFELQFDQIAALKHDENTWSDWQAKFEQLYQLWQHKGFIAMATKLLHQYYPNQCANKDRVLTNTLHLFELLQQASQALPQADGLVHYFEQQILLQTNQAEAELRLESDQALIKIVTMHGSKGLEYPIVFIPFASRYRDNTRFGQTVKPFHGYYDTNAAEPVVCLGRDPLAIAKNQLAAEQESARLLYVAVTRAAYRCYIGLANYRQAERSAIGLLLNCQQQPLHPQAANLADTYAELISHDIIANNIDDLPRWQASAHEAVALIASKFSGKIERNWWLTSYSSLTRNWRQGGVSMPDRADDNDATTTALQINHSIRFQLTKGAATGNLLHDIFEHLDFDQPDWHHQSQYALSRFGPLPAPFTQTDLSLWLQDCLDCPLLPELSLSRLSRQQTKREVEFYFPLSKLRIERLSTVLQHYRQSGSDNDSMPMTMPNKIAIEGMVHGFIDLIFFWQGKVYLVDYKSTYLGDKFDDYQPAALKSNIEKSYYDLQYLIYATALNRYLAQRIPNYQFDQHFGGVFYLYLRGMQKNQNSGVYYEPLSKALIDQLDRAFNGDDDHV